MTYDEFIQGIIDTRGRFGIHSEEYHERHHIVPKCMGGTNDEENLIDLFAREHYEAHKLLALENPDNRGLQIAWLNMSTTKNQYHKREVVTAEEFEQARKACSRAMSGSGNPMYGDYLAKKLDVMEYRFLKKVVVKFQNITQMLVGKTIRCMENIIQ